jgi:hypothetical protein
MSTNCDICGAVVSHIKNISSHKKTDKCMKVKQILDNKCIYYTNQIKEYNEQLKKLQDKILLLEKENTMNKEKAEEYRTIVEKTNINSNSKFKIKEQQNVLDTTFQIDINLDHKQLNKTKYKDVPEELARDIQTLKLEDNYQLEYRDEDGFINITNLCKAGGKKFNDWNRLDKTKKYLQVLSLETGIPVSELIKVGSGSKTINDTKNLTWAHPQVSINIAQWISAEFDVLVSKWVYEIMLTGKVDIRYNKTTIELDALNKENKLLKNRIKLLESKTLQKQPRETFEENKNVIYIVTTEFKEAQGHYKIGKAQDLQKRMSVYNTTDKHEVIYNTSCKTKKNMDILEQLVHNRLESKRVEPNKEWFKSEEEGEDLIKLIEELKKVVDF